MKAAELKRLTPSMMLAEAVVALVDSDPGAATACAALIKAAADNVDPGQPFGGHGPFFALDELEIYGHGIWVLYKNVCEYDALKLTALLRGWRLGIVQREALVNASLGKPAPLGVSPINAERVLEQVKAQLPRFGRPNAGRAALLGGKVLK